MIKINKIDLSIIGFGFLVAFTAWIRFFIHGSDLGETALAGLIGILFVLNGIQHHNQKKIEKRITKLNTTLYDVETYLADMNREE